MATAKTTRPTVTGSLVRPRLFRLLDVAGKKPVTWVAAPPGAGKTVLVATYAIARKLPSVWYQLDNGDNDLATFFYFMGLAVPKRGRPLPLFTPEYRQGISTFTRKFFRELYGRLKTPFVLVFDNYQEVPLDSELHEVMREAVVELPLGSRAIFISRSEPPGSFARLRAQQAVEMLGWPEIRFTEAEMRGLARRLAPDRPKQSIARLYEMADGWVAGLVLLLEHQGNGMASDHSEPSEVLFEYFAGEIFKKMAAEAREVLLQTAFLPRVTAAMADKLTGLPNAGQLLGDLHRQNYFINRRSADDVVYEYHPMLREFLLAEGQRVFSAERIGEIRHAAASLLESAGRTEAAVALFRDAADWQGIARLICSQAPTLLAQGRVQTLEAWLGMLPPEAFDRVPWLLYWRGLCGLGWGDKDRRRDCEKALAIFREHHDLAGMFLAWSAVPLLCQSESNHLPLDAWIAELDALMQEAPEFPSETIEAQVAAAMLLAVRARKPHHPSGRHWAERALLLTRQQSNPAFHALTAFNWFLYYVELGEFAKAPLVVDEMRLLMRSRDVSVAVALNAGMTVVWYESLFGLQSYRHTMTQMLVLAKSAGMFYVSKYIALAGGLVGALSDGDLETAEHWLGEMAKDLALVGVGFRSWYHRFTVSLALLRQDFGLAAEHQPEMLSLAISGGMPLQEATALLLSALVFHERKQREGADTCLNRAYEIVRTMHSPYVEFMMRTVEAHICFDNGEEAEALESLRIAMELGRKGGFVNSQVWMPKIMARLCVKALEAGIEVDYVRMLVRKRKLVPEEPPVDIEAWPWPVRIYTLGRFAVLKDDKPLEFARKVQRKPLALLKVVIALGGRAVREDTLIDSLWPDADGDAAHFALTSAIHRLRQLLGYQDAIIRQDNEITLNNRYCWVDVWAFERLLTRADAAISRSDHNGQSWAEYTGLVRRAAELYKGPFLGGDVEASCATGLADRLRRRFLREHIRVGEYREHNSDWQGAINCYEAGLRVDPCAEDVCRRLMAAYHHLGRPAEVLSTYRRCVEVLKAQVGVGASFETQSLLNKLHPAIAEALPAK